MLKLLPFSNKQIVHFINSYALFSQKEKSRIISCKDAELVIKSIISDKSKRLHDLASRPVQLKMLIEILPSWIEKLDHLTISILYCEFIDLIIRREMEKLSRSSYSEKERHLFACEFAFWMWENNSQKFQKSSDMPDSIFIYFRRNDESLDCIKRELLSSCFLEKRRLEGFFYPHRSLQEFFVAQDLYEHITEYKYLLENDIV